HRRPAVARRNARRGGRRAGGRTVSPDVPRPRRRGGGARRRARLPDPGDDARQGVAHEAAEPGDRPAGPPARGRHMRRAAPLARLVVGIVVERRRAKSVWADFVWRPVAALPGVPETPPWTALEGDDEAMRFYAGSAEVELHRADTPHYRDNLASGDPGLWV